MLSPLSSWKRPLQPGIVAKQIKTALLGSLASRVAYEALQAEAVRVALWALCVSCVPTSPASATSLADAAVATRRLLARARILLLPLDDAAQNRPQASTAQQQAAEKSDDASETALDREFLERLADQGDLLALSEGCWLPAPLRLVPVTRSRFLLVGGTPTRLLLRLTGNGLQFHGTFRYINDAALFREMSPAVSWQFQSCEHWLGPVPPSLADLAREFAQKELQPVSRPLHSRSQSLEAYVPHLDQPQRWRWQPLNRVEDGRYLLRAGGLWGMWQYSVGLVQAHQLIQQSSELRSTDIRRLCYALDYEAGMPTRARWNRKSGVLTLYSELPTRERKFLSTLGQLQPPKRGYYPRRWTNIAGDDAETVDRLLEMLAQLGIHIEHEHTVKY